MYTLEGYDAAKLKMELLVPNVRPGGKKIIPMPIVSWEDASEEERRTLNWKESFLKEGYAYRKRTQEENEEIRLEIKLNILYRIERIYKMLLTNYGWEYAEKYLKEKEDVIEKYQLEIHTSPIPRCEYSKDNQCHLLCDFFQNGKCTKGGK